MISESACKSFLATTAVNIGTAELDEFVPGTNEPRVDGFNIFCGGRCYNR